MSNASFQFRSPINFSANLYTLWRHLFFLNQATKHACFNWRKSGKAIAHLSDLYSEELCFISWRPVYDEFGSIKVLPV